MKNFEKKYLKYKIKYSSFLKKKNKQIGGETPLRFDINSNSSNINDGSKYNNMDTYTHFKNFCNENNIIIESIEKIRCNTPPTNLTIELLQQYIFSGSENTYETEFMSYLKQIKNVNDLWSILCKSSFPLQCQDEILEEYRSKSSNFNNEFNVFVKKLQIKSKVTDVVTFHKNNSPENNSPENNSLEDDSRKMIGGAYHPNTVLMADNLLNALWTPLTCCKLYNPGTGNYDDSRIFCMSLPPDANNLAAKIRCLQKLILAGFGHDIKRLICLTDEIVDQENNMWMFLSTLDSNNYEFSRELIPDGTAGTVQNFIRVLGYLLGDNLRTVIHCLAGRGRTGSVVLLVLLYNEVLHNRYFANLPCAKANYELGIQVGTGLVDQQNELFPVQHVNPFVDAARESVMIQRLNLINLAIASVSNLNSVCLYYLPNRAGMGSNRDLGRHLIWNINPGDTFNATLGNILMTDNFIINANYEFV